MALPKKGLKLQVIVSPFEPEKCEIASQCKNNRKPCTKDSIGPEYNCQLHPHRIEGTLYLIRQTGGIDEEEISKERLRGYIEHIILSFPKMSIDFRLYEDGKRAFEVRDSRL